MSIYSTHDGLTKDQAIEIIQNRIANIDSMSDARIVEILEACVQVRDYDDQSDEYGYNNFWDTFKTP